MLEDWRLKKKMMLFQKSRSIGEESRNFYVTFSSSLYKAVTCLQPSFSMKKSRYSLGIFKGHKIFFPCNK
jgi:hypothetical protein